MRPDNDWLTLACSVANPACAVAFSDGDKVAINRIDAGAEYLAEQFRSVLKADDIQDMDVTARTLSQDAYTEASKG